MSKKLLIDCGEGWKWIHFFDFIYHLHKYLKALPESPSSLHWPPATTSCTGWYNITSVPLLSQLDFIKSQHDLRSFRGRCFFPCHHPKFGILAGGPGITDYLLIIIYRSFSSTHWLPNIHGSCFITYHAGWWVLLLHIINLHHVNMIRVCVAHKALHEPQRLRNTINSGNCTLMLLTSAILYSAPKKWSSNSRSSALVLVAPPSSIALIVKYKLYKSMSIMTKTVPPAMATTSFQVTAPSPPSCYWCWQQPSPRPVGSLHDKPSTIDELYYFCNTACQRKNRVNASQSPTNHRSVRVLVPQEVAYFIGFDSMSCIGLVTRRKTFRSFVLLSFDFIDKRQKNGRQRRGFTLRGSLVIGIPPLSVSQCCLLICLHEPISLACALSCLKWRLDAAV